MKITLNLNVEEAMLLIKHLGWVGFEMPYLNKFTQQLFRKIAKRIWDKVHSPEDQLKVIQASKSSVLQSIYNYKIPDGE